ncbi:MAG: glutamyl-tRNA reductase [Candidatus Angelobacter sp.]|jgi:glutamyl-tRNA reductase|nr:glutamyl-tRNA reductase [Candidatus Angelobacter sp.]
MKYCLIGINHKTAPVEVRERLAISESRLPEAVRSLASRPDVEEGIIFSTCNRVEVLARSVDIVPDLRGFLYGHFQMESSALDSHLYEYSGPDAIRHLFRVASSLDSMIVGEPQILGQVKEAYAVARSVGAVHSHMDALLSRAFAVAKRVRTETSVGSSAVSVASVAVDLAKKIFGSLQGKQVYLVGAGKMSEIAARHLIAHGAGAIFVANRTHERAVELAKKFNGDAIRFEQLYDMASEADIVITSTGAPHHIFRREHGEMFLQRRRNRPMFFIDIAVPRDVDPAVNELDGIFVYDIDDLQSVVTSHVADRQREASRAEEIINFEVQRFLERLDTLDVVPTIVSLQDHVETIRQAEIDKVRGRLGALSPEQELAVESLTKGIVNKILHTPITTLKGAAKDARQKDPEATTIIELVRKLFNLNSSRANLPRAAKQKTDVEKASLKS